MSKKVSINLNTKPFSEIKIGEGFVDRICGNLGDTFMKMIPIKEGFIFNAILLNTGEPACFNGDELVIPVDLMIDATLKED